MSAKLRRLGGLVLAAATTGLLGTFGAVGPTSISGAASTGQSCGTITVKGHEYSVYVTNVKCSVAKKWAPVMAAKKVPKNQLARLKGGPNGFSCVGYAGVEKGGTQGSGHCEKGLAGPNFNWAIFTTSS